MAAVGPAPHAPPGRRARTSVDARRTGDGRAAARHLDEDLPPLVPAWRRSVSSRPSPCGTTRPSTGRGFDLAVVRSTWDYAPRRDEFLAWAERVAASDGAGQPGDVLRWSTDKRYLADLAAAGVPSRRPRSSSRVTTSTCQVCADGELVVKPAIGAGSLDAERFPAERRAAAARPRSRACSPRAGRRWSSPTSPPWTTTARRRWCSSPARSASRAQGADPAPRRDGVRRGAVRRGGARARGRPTEASSRVGPPALAAVPTAVTPAAPVRAGRRRAEPGRRRPGGARARAGRALAVLRLRPRRSAERFAAAISSAAGTGATGSLARWPAAAPTRCWSRSGTASRCAAAPTS